MSAIDKLDSPFLNEQIDSRNPAEESGLTLEYEIARSPFVDSLELGDDETATGSDETENVEEADWETRVDDSSEVELWTPEADEATLLESPEAIDEAADQELEELYGEPPPVAAEEAEFEFQDETYARLNTRLKSLSLLAHFVEQGGTKTKLSPPNPGFYDGPVKYKIAPPLQKRLETVMKRKEFRHINVALVDFTKTASDPEFAGFKHKQNAPAENIAMIAPLLTAHQLRADLRVALNKKGLSSLPELFDNVRDDWAATQVDVKAPAKPFAGTITLRRDLVLFKGATVPLSEPKSSNLERIFSVMPAGQPAVVEFSTTREDAAQLQQVSADFLEGKPGIEAKVDGLGFLERLHLMMKGGSRASKYAASTVVADLGYLYIASTLLQYGLFDPARGGGLWLASNYAGGQWSAGAAIGGRLSANTGSVAAFFTLLAQDQLVDRDASAEMRALLTEDLAAAVPSRSLAGLQKLSDMGSLNSVLSRTGISPPAMHDCAVVERRPNPVKDDTIHYIAVGLNSLKSAEWSSLIVELDRCIQSNNFLLTPETEADFETEEWETEPESGDEHGAEPESEEEKGIIGGSDERMHVKDTLAVPFRWICQIWIQYNVKSESGKELRRTGLAPLASGVLISPRHVLTAAHVLHNIDKTGSVTEEQVAFTVELAPAANAKQNPFGRIEAKSWKTASKWKPGSPVSHWDYALITLNEAVGERTIKNWNDGKPLSFWGSASGGAGTSFDAAPPALVRTLVGARVGTAGYPASEKREMICAAGVLSAGAAGASLTSPKLVEDWMRRSGTLYTSADASAGQSGSPVWVLDGAKRYMVGILAAIGDNYNSVVNLRSDAVTEIQGWMK